MANKAKKTKKSSAKSASQRANDDNVVRIRAAAPAASAKSNEATEPAVTTKVKAAKTKTAKETKEPQAPKKAKSKAKPGNILLRILGGIGGYFKGAWVELRQVRWPNRRATWSLSIAVLIYSAFFVALILLLDAGFQYLFDLILGK